jgi:hypothetical protein
MKPDGYFTNGDQWHGADLREDGKRYFIATDSSGTEYETLEMPKRYPLFTMIQVPNGTNGDEAIRMIERAKA